MKVYMGRKFRQEIYDSLWRRRGPMILQLKCSVVKSPNDCISTV